MQTKDVEKIIMTNRIDTDKKIIVKRRKELIKMLYEEGWSTGDIAKIIRYDRTYIYRIATQK